MDDFSTLARINIAVDQAIFIFVKRVSSANIIGEERAEIIGCVRCTVLLAHSMNTN